MLGRLIKGSVRRAVHIIKYRKVLKTMYQHLVLLEKRENNNTFKRYLSFPK